jgi:hypothetical protein
MALIIGLKSILGWERLHSFGRYGYVEMIKYLTIKNSSVLQVIYRYTNTLCLWSSLQSMENRDLFMEVRRSGLCTVGDYGEGYFFPTWVAV